MWVGDNLNFVFLFFSVVLVIFCLFALYNVPVVVSGVRSLWSARKKRVASVGVVDRELPFVSVLVPVKNEEKVVGRLLAALLKVDYPEDKYEIIVVNDASIDKTRQICLQYGLRHPHVKVLDKEVSSTKAAALNFGLKQACGEIVATFDGDSVPEHGALRRAVEYFSDASVSGLQGRICSINSGQNILTRFLSYEWAVQFELYLRGKDSLNLFVGLAGTCQFIRKSVLDAVGGWNEGCLSEDTELSVRLAEKDYVVKYAPEVHTWEESPFDVRGLLAQRARWFRGNIETFARFGRLMWKPSLRRFDAEMTLFGTFVILLCLFNFVMPFWAFSVPSTFWTVVLAQFISVLTLTIMAAVGVTLACISKPLRLRNLLWLPFIYAYWTFQSLIAMYALLQVIFRRPQRWHKTSHLGVVTDACQEKTTEQGTVNA